MYSIYSDLGYVACFGSVIDQHGCFFMTLFFSKKATKIQSENFLRMNLHMLIMLLYKKAYCIDLMTTSIFPT